MKTLKWNCKNKKYNFYEIPDSWNSKTYCQDMDEIVNCASCGKKLPFGDCYTSRIIHTSQGFGYAVCSDCYEKEEK